MKKLLLTVSVALLALTAWAQGTPVTKVVDGKTYVVHKVVAGETLYKISKKYGCTVAEIQAANSTVKVLHPGDQLLVPQKQTTTSPTQPAVQNPTSGSGSSSSSDYITYKVKKGETLSKIARDHKTTVEALKTLNGIGNTPLKIGQVLKIPVVKSETVSDNPGTQPNPGTTVTKPDTPKTTQPVIPVTTKTEEKKTEPEKNNPGIPNANPGRVPVSENAVEKEESGTAKVLADKMDQTRTFVMHPSLPKGSIIVLINEATGKMAYCRVVDNIRDTDLGGASIAITKAVADKLGMTGNSSGVKIKYAAP